MPAALPSAHARVVVIGGGIAGCSVAYHLTKLGWRDVLLLERRDISCGTTWHAAGLVGQLRATQNLTRLAKYGGDLYERLEAETGQATGFRRPGSLSLARNAERMHELKRLASMARCFDVDVEVITPSEAGRRWPLMRTDDLVGALWLPRDGRTNPIDTTLALARGARQGGATVLENVAVTGIRVQNGRVAGVTTSSGEVACEVVVNCAGMWARDVGRLAGVTVPLHASEHFYIVTEPMAGVTPDLPVLRDTDGYIYVREEVGGLLMGGFEPVAKPWGMDGIPADFGFSLLPEDWEHFQVLMEQALIRIPALESAPVRRHVNGPESFTPDGRYLLGEAPECRNFFVAAGFSSIGIESGAGAGRPVAAWIVGGEPPTAAEGPDALAVLQRLCANDVDVAPGRRVYTQMLNVRGGIEADLTVTRLAADAFLVVTGAAASTHNAHWIRRHIGEARAVLTDVTSSEAVLGVMGPRSRELLSRLTDADLSSAAFPYLTSREIWLAAAPVRAARVTYVGELGWELYIPAEFAGGVYDAVVAAGDDLGLRHAGYHAMDSLRIEKAYRSWGHDLGCEDTPLEAGLGFAVRFDKRHAFTGQDALLAQREKPLVRRLLVFILDDPEPLLYHDEPIWRDGALVGRIASGAYGHTVGRSVGLGWVSHPDGVTDGFVTSGRWEIEIACERRPARAQLAPPYDPRSLRVRA